MIEIEKMTLDDIPSVLKLGGNIDAFQVTEKDCFWTQSQLEAWVTADEDVLLVARKDAEIVGFVLSTFHRPTGKVIWENLFVIPSCRGYNIDSKLIQHLLESLRLKDALYICFCVRTNSPKKLSYFKRKGFDQGLEFVWFGKNIHTHE